MMSSSNTRAMVRAHGRELLDLSAALINLANSGYVAPPHVSCVAYEIQRDAANHSTSRELQLQLFFRRLHG